MDRRVKPVAFRVGAFRQRIAWIFGSQLVFTVFVCALGVTGALPAIAVISLIVIATNFAWLAARHEWRPVMALASVVNQWDGRQLDPESLHLERLSPQTDADVASLARGLHGFATRIAGYNQRERNFTRDASHELRSPLTVIKMSVDMLADEEGLSEFGARSLRRIIRATREMEILVEALLILARESDDGSEHETFVVNDVLKQEMVSARELLAGRPIKLQLEESARFALQGSPQAFSVLCWQLIRNACQQTEQGRIVVSVMPGLITVTNHSESGGDSRVVKPLRGADRHGFELAIAQRISARFHWALELQTLSGDENVARLTFPHTLPVVETHPHTKGV
jgi:signal transduction histidine kinase